MSQHQGFEKWARSEGLISESHGVRFVNSQCDVAQKAWQASRTQALEEAAQYCLKIMGRVSSSYYADLIRAIAREER